MRNQLLLAQAIAVSIFLSGCGQSKLDARQLDFNNGLAYQHGLTTPFTGEVEWKDQLPNQVTQFWSSVVGKNLADTASSCETQFSAGVLEGLATCSSPTGQEILEVTFKNEAVEGTSKFYNAINGKLNRKLHWSAGKLDGPAEFYTDDGDRLLEETSWENGLQDGRAKLWDADGTLQSDTVWESGKIVSGKINDARGSREYKDGQLDGPETLLAANGKTVIAKGVYSAGRRTGAWEDWLGPSTEDFDSFIVAVWEKSDGILGFQALQQLPSHFQGSADKAKYVKSIWNKDGELDGDVLLYDKDNKLIMSFHAKNDLLDGSFQYWSAWDGKQYSSTFTDGKLSRMDAATVVGQAQSATP